MKGITTTTIYKYTCIVCLVLSSWLGEAQTLSRHTWYYGNGPTGLRFNRVTNAATQLNNKANPFSVGGGGSSVASDHHSANLLFYTDGLNVFDISHALMANGGALNGNTSSNQPTAICAIPGQPGMYYIFTNTASFPAGGAIFRSVVDMNLFGNAGFPSPAFGEVVTKNVAIASLGGQSEGMITVPHANGNDFWLITQSINTQTFNATLIDAATFTSGIFNTVASTSSLLPTSAAHLSYHEGLRKIAVAPQDPSTDAIIMNFNATSGVISFDRTIFNSGFPATGNQMIYDIEWSPSGRYLYLSRFGEAGFPANVFQYDYMNAGVTLAPVLPSPVFRSYGLQLGPDNNLYHLYQSASGGSFLLGRFTRPDMVSDSVAYDAAPFGATNFSGMQFPSFLPKDTIDLKLDFTTAGTCANSPTIFFPEVEPGADSLFWNFGDNNGGRGWGPIHTYSAGGTYDVTMYAFYQGQIDSVTNAVTINDFLLQLQMTTDTTACRCEFPPPRGQAPASCTEFSVKLNVSGGTPASIVWSNGDLGDTLTPDSAGYYYAVVTDASGCAGYAPVNVREYGLIDQTFNKWYFGNRAGIDFNLTPPAALSESVMDAPEGCAIVCDRNGQTIFYTDGVNVWDKTHAMIETDIGGNPASTQSSLIVAVPEDETIFFIFTTQAINGTDSLQLSYSVFDLKQNSGTGAVIKKSVFLFAKSTERITASGRWLIVHEYGNSTFRTYPISADGLGDVVFTSIGSDHSFLSKENGEGYMRLGPGNIIAVPLSVLDVSNHIELFNLNDTTGHLYNYRDIDLDEPTGSIYGLEFSPGGNKLFATLKTGASTSIFEYSIDSVGNPDFKGRQDISASLGAIQMGPDGQLYVANDDIGSNGFLGTIPVNEDTTVASPPFQLNGFALATGTNSRLGLPNFIQQNPSAIMGPAISVTGLCLGDSTQFSATPRDQIDEYNWRVFQAGAVVATSTDATFGAVFTTPGNYSVSLILHNRCAPDTTMTRNFVINQPPADPTAGVTLCTGPAVLDANPLNMPGLTYTWSTGASTETITVNDQRVVTVLVADQNQCSVVGTFLVADNRPQFDLGPDLTICEDNNTPALDVGNPGMDYQWRINGVPTSTISSQAVDTDLPGVFTYEVTVHDPVLNCTVTEEKVYTIGVSPNFTFTGVDPTGACGSATGSVTLQINASTPLGGPLYQYFISGPGAAQQGIDQTAPSTINIPNLTAGTYSAVVNDQISGCTLSDVFSLTDATVTASAISDFPNCDPVEVTVTISGPMTGTLNWTATESSTLVQTTGTAATAPFTTTPLPAGSYDFAITDSTLPTPCTVTFSHVVAPNPSPAITFTPNLCTRQLTATSTTPGLTFAWTSNPAGGITGPTTGATISLTPGTTPFTYIATASGAGICTSTDSTTLTVGNLATPTLAQSDGCQTSVFVSATPPINGVVYRWYRNDVLDISLGGTQIALGVADHGTRFSAEIFDPVSGCTTPRTPNLIATVVAPITATLASTPPCDDGEPITLSVTTTTPGVTFRWLFEGSAIAGATSASHTDTREGQYTAEISYPPAVSPLPCTVTGNLDIVRAALPDGALPNRVVICNDPENVDPSTQSIDLDPGPFSTYDWSKNNLSLGYTARVLNADSEGLYEVLLTNAFSCVNIDETEVLNECIPKITAPNVFRPSSGIYNEMAPSLSNSEFWVISKFIEDDGFFIFIFNRWGEMVYSSTDRYFKWNGGYNNNAGQPLPPGTYSYVIKYVNSFRPDLGAQEQRGGVALLR
jgi:gliding motility-associated-like protein